MKVLLWQLKHTGLFDTLVLWDGENTYWHDEMIPSPGYKNIQFNKWHKIGGCRFVLLGDL